MSATPEGWYDDSEVPGGERWWDGEAWTGARRAKPVKVRSTAPGWYVDPDMVDTLRYWDGDGWTEHRQAQAQSSGWPKIVIRLAGVVFAMLLVWLVFGPGWQIVTGRGTEIDVTELTDTIKSDLDQQGFPVKGFTCDDPGDVKQGDVTYCRGTTKGQAITIKVTFGRDGRYSYEAQ